MRRLLMLLLRAICYLCLAAVIFGFGSLIVFSFSGLCPKLDAGGVWCATDWLTSTAEIGLGIVIVTVFTGFPGLFAIGGLIFAFRDFRRFLRQRGT